MQYKYVLYTLCSVQSLEVSRSVNYYITTKFNRIMNTLTSDVELRQRSFVSYGSVMRNERGEVMLRPKELENTLVMDAYMYSLGVQVGQIYELIFGEKNAFYFRFVMSVPTNFRYLSSSTCVLNTHESVSEVIHFYRNGLRLSNNSEMWNVQNEASLERLFEKVLENEVIPPIVRLCGDYRYHCCGIKFYSIESAIDTTIKVNWQRSFGAADFIDAINAALAVDGLELIERYIKIAMCVDFRDRRIKSALEQSYGYLIPSSDTARRIVASIDITSSLYDHILSYTRSRWQVDVILPVEGTTRGAVHPMLFYVQVAKMGYKMFEDCAVFLNVPLPFKVTHVLGR